MKNPFPALITYMLVQTVMLFPLATCISLAVVMLVGWGLALGELIPLFSNDQSVEATYLD